MADMLKILDELDKFRRTHQDTRQHPADFCMRCMEAIVAKAAGYENRMEWTDALRADPESSYSKDLSELRLYGF